MLKLAKRILMPLLIFSIYSTPSLAVDCGDSVIRNVTLKKDLDCSSYAFALSVFSDNVTIDLNGHTLSGSPTTRGIQIVNFDGLTVKNGAIRGFSMAVNTSRSDHLKVHDVTFYETGAAVIVNNGNNAKIERNKFISSSSNDISIKALTNGLSAKNNIVANNEFFQGSIHAVQLCGKTATNNVILDNLVWKSGSSAFALEHANYNRINGNRILDSSDMPAIKLDSASYNLIQDNVLQNEEHTGIALGKNPAHCLDSGSRGSLKNQIQGNRIDGFPTAITLGSSTELPNTIEGNGILENGLTNASTGVFFNEGTKDNIMKANNFLGTRDRVVDLGVNNRY